jgi:hypothetical protein
LLFGQNAITAREPRKKKVTRETSHDYLISPGFS